MTMGANPAQLIGSVASLGVRIVSGGISPWADCFRGGCEIPFPACSWTLHQADPVTAAAVTAIVFPVLA